MAAAHGSVAAWRRILFKWPRWRFDGEVDVLSGHFRIPSVKSVYEISGEIGGASDLFSWSSIKRVSGETESGFKRGR